MMGCYLNVQFQVQRVKSCEICSKRTKDSRQEPAGSFHVRKRAEMRDNMKFLS